MRCVLSYWLELCWARQISQAPNRRNTNWLKKGNKKRNMSTNADTQKIETEAEQQSICIEKRFKFLIQNEWFMDWRDRNDFWLGSNWLIGVVMCPTGRRVCVFVLMCDFIADKSNRMIITRNGRTTMRVIEHTKNCSSANEWRWAKLWITHCSRPPRSKIGILLSTT